MSDDLIRIVKDGEEAFCGAGQLDYMRSCGYEVSAASLPSKKKKAASKEAAAGDNPKEK